MLFLHFCSHQHQSLPFRNNSAYSHGLQLLEKTGLLLDLPKLAFGLRGKESALSRLHCDPDGLLSVIQLLSGKKIWIIQVTTENVPPLTLENLKRWGSKYWEVIFLEEGDTM